MNSNDESSAPESAGKCKGKHGFRRRHMWKFPFIFAAIVLVKSALVMVLWNALVPEIFHGPSLDYLQALGLLVLAKLLLGFGGHRGFAGMRGHHGHGFGGRCGGRGPWHEIGPEERIKIREELKKRFGEST